MITIAEIRDSVAKFYGITPTQMMSESRRYAFSHPRQVAMYLARELTDASLPMIGRQLGRKDHTTVLHAIRRVRSRAECMAAVDALRPILKAVKSEREERIEAHLKSLPIIPNAPARRNRNTITASDVPKGSPVWLRMTLGDITNPSAARRPTREVG